MSVGVVSDLHAFLILILDLLVCLDPVAYIDENGRASKPFLLPQRNPRKYYLEEMDSYNCIDFTNEKVQLDAREVHKRVFENKREQVKIR